MSIIPVRRRNKHHHQHHHSENGRNDTMFSVSPHLVPFNSDRRAEFSGARVWRGIINKAEVPPCPVKSLTFISRSTVCRVVLTNYITRCGYIECGRCRGCLVPAMHQTKVYSKPFRAKPLNVSIPQDAPTIRKLSKPNPQASRGLDAETDHRGGLSSNAVMASPPNLHPHLHRHRSLRRSQALLGTRSLRRAFWGRGAAHSDKRRGRGERQGGGGWSRLRANEKIKMATCAGLGTPLEPQRADGREEELCTRSGSLGFYFNCGWHS